MAGDETPAPTIQQVLDEAENQQVLETQSTPGLFESETSESDLGKQFTSDLERKQKLKERSHRQAQSRPKDTTEGESPINALGVLAKYGFGDLNPWAIATTAKNIDRNYSSFLRALGSSVGTFFEEGVFDQQHLF